MARREARRARAETRRPAPRPGNGSTTSSPATDRKQKEHSSSSSSLLAPVPSSRTIAQGHAILDQFRMVGEELLQRSEQLAAIGGTPLPTRPTTTAIPDEERGSIRSGGTRRPTPPGTTARGLPKAPKRAAGVRPAKNQDVQKTIKDLQNQKGKPDPKAMKRVIETLQGLQKP